MVEPLEETRNELIFATEPLLSSLDSSIPGSSRHSPLVELDEVEVRDEMFLLDAHWTRYVTDPEGYSANMQRIIIPSLVCAIDTFEHMSRKYRYQQFCQSLNLCQEDASPWTNFTGRLENSRAWINHTLTRSERISHSLGVSYIWWTCATLYSAFLWLYGYVFSPNMTQLYTYCSCQSSGIRTGWNSGYGFRHVFSRLPDLCRPLKRQPPI